MSETTDNFPWRIEYEVFPFRAIFTAYAHGDYSEDQCRKIFREKVPRGNIRSVTRMTESTELLDFQPKQP